MSRKFPPTFKRRWYIFLRSDGKYKIAIVETSHAVVALEEDYSTLNQALDVVAPVNLKV